MIKSMPRVAFLIASALTLAWHSAQSQEPASPAEPSAAAEPAPASDTAPAAAVETVPVIEAQPVTPPQAAAPASGEQPQRLDDIQVTANKRVQTLDQVAGSVGAIRGDQLEKTGAKDLEGFLKLVPGVSLNKQEAGSFAPSIRGIASDTKLGISQAATGIYIDDVSFTGPYASFHTIDMNPFDLERIEILKGPQATLYGTNSMAGTIRYILQKPKLDTWELKGSVDHLSVDEGSAATSGALAVNVPLGSEVAVRAAGTRNISPGYVDDSSVGKDVVDGNRAVQEQGRVLAAWQPSDFPLKVLGTYLVQRTNQAEASFTDQTEDYSRSNTPVAQFINSSFNLASLTAEYSWSGASLFSSTSLQHKNLTEIIDGSRALGTQFQALTTTTLPQSSFEENLSQELRLSSPEDGGAFSWLGGLLYSRYKDQLMLGIHQSPELPLVPDIYNEDTRSVGTERAAFGEIDLTLLDRWFFSAGGRYFQAELNSNSHVDGVLTLASTGMLTADSLAVLKESGFSPKVSLRFEASDSVSLYGLVSRGVRFGGNQFLDPPALAGAGIPKAYKSDSLWNYELGLRSNWFERKLKFDLTAFYLKWKDLQIQRAALRGLYHYVDNVGAAQSKGLEVAIRIAPFSSAFLSGLSLSSSAAYIKAETTVPFDAGQDTVAAGTRLPGTPKLQYTSVLAYEGQFGSVAPGLLITHSYIGASPNNLFGSVQVGDYSTLDADLRVTLTRWRFTPTISLSVHNMLNSHALAGATADPGTSYTDYYLVRPRTIGTSISFSLM